MSKFAIIEICNVGDLKVGDNIIYSDVITEIKEIKRFVFACSDDEVVPKTFKAYYKVIDKGDRLKIKNWKELLC